MDKQQNQLIEIYKYDLRKMRVEVPKESQFGTRDEYLNYLRGKWIKVCGSSFSLVLMNGDELLSKGLWLNDLFNLCNKNGLFAMTLKQYIRFKTSVYIEVSWFNSKVSRQVIDALMLSEEGGVKVYIGNKMYMDIKIFQEDLANDLDDRLELQTLQSKKQKLDAWHYVYDDLSLYEQLSREEWGFYLDHREAEVPDYEFFKA